jgi:hypothetical protein
VPVMQRRCPKPTSTGSRSITLRRGPSASTLSLRVQSTRFPGSLLPCWSGVAAKALQSNDPSTEWLTRSTWFASSRPAKL